jgi:hypothetical protein
LTPGRLGRTFRAGAAARWDRGQELEGAARAATVAPWGGEQAGAGPSGRWSAERARAWADARPWLVGFNFLPSSAVNFLEMWRGETFDPATIARELGWGADIGFNALRTNLHYLDWQRDRSGLIDRLDRFLDIAAGLGLGSVLCLFDDCEFSGEAPIWGRQPPPRPGIHNSRALGSPGRASVSDRTEWPNFQAYFHDVLGAFGRDPRVVVWDLYNEPGNRMIFELEGQREHDVALEADSYALMRACFEWARAADPAQPLTVGAWRLSPHATGASYVHPIDQAALDLSDVISFHAYCPLDRLRRVTDDLARLGRPMLCTEWMARGVGSRIADQLPFFRERGIGAFQWGLVRGRTQTHLAWPGVLPAEAADGPWFHDLLDEAGLPHSRDETALIGRLSTAPRRPPEPPRPA